MQSGDEIRYMEKVTCARRSDDWPESETMKPHVRRLPPFHPTAHLTNHIVEISLNLAPLAD